MIETNPTEKDLVSLKTEQIQFTFQKSGDLYLAGTDSIMLNQVLTNPVDGSLNNLYLRIFKKDGSIISEPLLGIKSMSIFYKGKKHVKWKGSFEEIRYTVTFSLTDEAIWFWQIELEGDGQEADVIYGQDIGLASTETLQANEAYVAQYIDHQIFQNDASGFAVCSRQSQNQGKDRFPYLQQGSLTPNVGYGTDGFQFFGKTYKETDIPEGLTKEQLPSEIYQYEFNYTTLQSSRLLLTEKKEIIFYGLFKENHPEAITELEFRGKIENAWQQLKNEEGFLPVEKVAVHSSIGDPLRTQTLSEAELSELYPKRLQEERSDGKLLSFFTDSYEHVVLKEKETRMERAHGHILFSGSQLSINKPILTTTSWIYGVFNSQVVVGNTSMNKFLTNTRNPLNTLKTSGQRIYVKINENYQLLTMPSLFEMGFNFAKWLYKTETETFIVTNYTHSNKSEVKLRLETESGKDYAYLITNQIVLNDTEYKAPFEMTVKDNWLQFKPGKDSVISGAYPDLVYYMQLKQASMTVTDETALADSVASGTASLVVLKIEPANQFELILQGSVSGASFDETESHPEAEKEKFCQFISGITSHFKLSHHGNAQEISGKMNATVWWYTHNMFIHYLVPHGLEQYGGAAWGTRDVSQGPAEYFMAMQQYDVVRQIIKELFSHQFEEDGNWPQWFMFGRYSHIQADESHGDVIVWPLKMLSDYLAATNDLSILDERVPYMSRQHHQYTEKQESIIDHVQKEITYIKDHFLLDTHLSAYGDGDWDDTLQPYDKQLKKHMVSSWTVELTYQTLKQFSEVIQNEYAELSKKFYEMTENIYQDFHRYILSDRVIPGFIYMENQEEVEFMIHPSDSKTGIQYRLLPMTRGMISELFTPEQAEAHYQLIKKELQYPDGVRLMNRPATYQGGVSTNFKRAEQAANFGREIGLQYVHAHIRFAEAMAKLGKRDEAWNAIQVINPITITEVVPNAERRQSNAYFSSSDADFKTRYEAQENFGKLRTNEVKVKGGWRIYSSGPGIYLNQLISNVLGIRVENKNLIIDPVLPEELNGLTLDYTYAGIPVQYRYHLKTEKDSGILINGAKVSTTETANPYRKGGMLVLEKDARKELIGKTNVIDIYC